MNQRAKFSVEVTEDDKISADIEGSVAGIINLLANVLDGNDDLQMAFRLALEVVNPDNNDLSVATNNVSNIVGEA
jgi:hypothetical protein